MSATERRVLSGPAAPIRSVKTVDLIIDELRRMIVLHGHPGDYLPPERVLTEKFEVSRPTLREAIRVLDSEGLVRIRRGVRGGAQIVQPSIHDLARRFGLFLQMEGTTGSEVFVLRRIVEPAAAALVAHDPEAARGPLTTVLEHEGDLLERMRSDEQASVVLVDFHDAILDLSENRALSAVGRLLDVIVTHHTHRTLSSVAQGERRRRLEALKKSHAAHTRITEAILSGDAAAAEHLMSEHIAALEHLTPPEVAEATIDIVGSEADVRNPEWPWFQTETMLS